MKYAWCGLIGVAIASAAAIFIFTGSLHFGWFIGLAFLMILMTSYKGNEEG